MNLIEAIKSGKRYRSIGSSVWLEPNRINSFTDGAVLADWEVEEEKIEITRSQLNQALSANIKRHSMIGSTFARLDWPGRAYKTDAHSQSRYQARPAATIFLEVSSWISN